MNAFLPKHLLARCYARSATSASKWHTAGYPSTKSILDDDDSGPLDLSEDNDIVNRVRPGTPPLHRRKPPKTPTPEEHLRHRQILKEKFPDGWNPPRKISREAMDGLRSLHHFEPDKFTTPFLADKFKISPEAVRRILKAKWEPSKERRLEMREKERKSKTEFVKLSRLQEKMEMEAAFAEKREERQKTHGFAGVDEKDGFTFG
ncbi:hypothetical protein BDZ89DRAFT_1068771 [Hymenopellis radicata]|nr:hypothetical protein BDZ89DRAFT_1068771 [Hymenopellis radicata]